MNNKKPDSRPVYLNLLRIRQPITAITSIGHRISGVLLFLSIPCLIWMLERSLSGPEGYQQVMAFYDSGFAKLIVLLVAWSFVHHLFAGIRFLLLDIEWGVEIETARKTAMVANICGVLGVLAVLVMLL
ncbi:succinate dehydrogenase, cytochrome b556 subunit [Pseudomonadota bacterium]